MALHDHTATPASDQASASRWLDTLISDSSAFDDAGVQAAMLSVRVRNDMVSKRTMDQLRTLLSRLLSPTDRLETISDSSISILLAPQPDLQTTVAQVRSIADAVQRSGIHASTGFAHRRVGESLLDTWARAEAQLDRAVYRIEHRDGLTL